MTIRAPVPAFHVVATAISISIIAPVLVGFTLDATGILLTRAVIAASIGFLALIFLLALWHCRSHISAGLHDRRRIIGAAGLITAILVIGLSDCWPTFLPTSGSVDAVHHFALISFIDRHNHLVHDFSEAGNLGEMTGYPVAACLYIVILSRLTNVAPIFLMTPTCVLLLAFTAFFVYALITELGDRFQLHLIAAVVTALVVLWPSAYTIGQYTRDFFVTQMMGVLVLTGAWYWMVLIVCRAQRLILPLVFGFGLVLVLSYPTLLPILALFIAITPLCHASRPPWFTWAAQVASLGVPLLLFALLTQGTNASSGLEILRHDGITIAPSVDTLPIAFVFLALVGVASCLRNRNRRLTTVGLASAAAMSIATYAATYGFGEFSPYAAKKTVFVIVPMLAVFAGIALVDAIQFVQRRFAAASQYLWIATTLSILGVVSWQVVGTWSSVNGTLIPPRDDRTPLTLDQYAAGTSGVGLFGNSKLTYFTSSAITAYWVDIGLLRRLRIDLPTRFDPTQEEYQRWWLASPAGAEAFVAGDFDALVGPESEILLRAGSSGIVRKRKGAAPPPFMTVVGSSLIYDGAELSARRVNKGELLSVTPKFIRRAGGSVAFHVQVSVLREDGTEIARGESSALLNPVAGTPDRPNSDSPTVVILIPADAAPGPYSADLTILSDQAKPLPVEVHSGTTVQSLLVGSITVKNTNDQGVANRPTTTVDRRVGNAIELVGFDPPRVSVGNVAVDLFWTSTQPVHADYTVFVQLLDAANNVVAQSDSYPEAGNYPTSDWEPSESILDRHHLVPKQPLTAGEYHLIAGLYTLETMQRLPVTNGAGALEGDFVDLGTVTVR